MLPDLEDRIELHVRRMLQYMVPIVAFGFVLAVLIVDLAPIWRFVAPRRMRTLDRDRAERLLGEMGRSRWKVIRTMILGIRGIVVSAFYDQDEAHQAMNFHPLPFFTNRIQLRQRLLAGETADAEDALGAARERQPERKREGEGERR